MKVQIDDAALNEINRLIKRKYIHAEESEKIVRMLIEAISSDDDDEASLAHLKNVLEELARRFDSLGKELAELNLEVEAVSDFVSTKEVEVQELRDAASSLRYLQSGQGVIPIDHARIELLPNQLELLADALQGLKIN
jgi:chromosome segregation ATPase